MARLAPAPEQLGGRELVHRARGDEERRIQQPRGEDDVEVRRVVGGGDHEAPRPPDSGAIEHRVLGGITLEDQEPGLRGEPAHLRPGVHHHHRNPRLVQLVRRLAPHPPVARDDEVPLQPVDALLHAPFPPRLPDGVAGEVIEPDGERVEEAADPGHCDGDGEEPPRVVQGLHLAVADGGHRGEGHEQRVHPGAAAVPPEPVVAEDSHHVGGDQQPHRQRQPRLQTAGLRAEGHGGRL